MNSPNIPSSIDNISALLKSEKEKHKTLITNCYLLPDQLKTYVGEGRVTYEIVDDGIILLCDMDCYYNLYYYINPQKGIRLEKRDKPVVVEFHDSHKRHNKQNDIMIPYWEKSGFEYNATVRRMVCEYTEESINALTNAHETRFDVVTATPQHFEEILRLLYEGFNPIDNMFPNKAALRSDLESGNFKCIADKDGHVIGAMQSVIKGNRINMSRLVVNPEYRRQNISWHLRKHEAKRAWNLGISQCVNWVLEGNEAALFASQKMGMKFDGRYNIHCILR